MELAIPPVFVASAAAEAGAAAAGCAVVVDVLFAGWALEEGVCVAPMPPKRLGALLVAVVAGFVAAEELAPPVFPKRDGIGAAVEVVVLGPLGTVEATGLGNRDGAPVVEPAVTDPNRLLAGAAVEAGAVIPGFDD